MRNLMEYPITRAERVMALENALQLFYREDGVGDIRPVAIGEILQEELAKLAEEEMENE